MSNTLEWCASACNCVDLHPVVNYRDLLVRACRCPAPRLAPGFLLPSSQNSEISLTSKFLYLVNIVDHFHLCIWPLSGDQSCDWLWLMGLVIWVRHESVTNRSNSCRRSWFWVVWVRLVTSSHQSGQTSQGSQNWVFLSKQLPTQSARHGAARAAKSTFNFAGFC